MSPGIPWQWNAMSTDSFPSPSETLASLKTSVYDIRAVLKPLVQPNSASMDRLSQAFVMNQNAWASWFDLTLNSLSSSEENPVASRLPRMRAGR